MNMGGRGYNSAHKTTLRKMPFAASGVQIDSQIGRYVKDQNEDQVDLKVY